MSIAENLAKIESGIHSACERSSRSREEVQLVAVSKTKPFDLIAEAHEAGQLHFGENKVQELTEKQPQFDDAAVQWHLIGHLQTNKIRKALPCCDLLHTLDSLKLATAIDRISCELATTTQCLIQVNISADPAKHGFAKNELKIVIEEILSKPNLQVLGLMTIPSYDPDPEATRSHFSNLREFRDHLENEYSISLPHLSMGMSHDYHVAIEEGATIVRVGSSIFGAR